MGFVSSFYSDLPRFFLITVVENPFHAQTPLTVEEVRYLRAGRSSRPLSSVARQRMSFRPIAGSAVFVVRVVPTFGRLSGFRVVSDICLGPIRAQR